MASYAPMHCTMFTTHGDQCWDLGWAKSWNVLTACHDVPVSPRHLSGVIRTKTTRTRQDFIEQEEGLSSFHC